MVLFPLDVQKGRFRTSGSGLIPAQDTLVIFREIFVVTSDIFKLMFKLVSFQILVVNNYIFMKIKV
jgi:hypothetical protein